MGKKKRDTPRAATEPQLSNHPFAALAGLRGGLPEGEAAPVPSDEVPATPATARRAVVRYQRKGRGGKEVTLVEKLALPADELEGWCRDLKRALGCGGSIEGDAIALAGDQRERLPPLLTARGVARISVSG